MKIAQQELKFLRGQYIGLVLTHLNIHETMPNRTGITSFLSRT